MIAQQYVLKFKDLSLKDLASVGGKNASLGEMISSLPEQIKVPSGFATSAKAYWDFIDSNNLRPGIAQELQAFKAGSQDLQATGTKIRNLIYQAQFPAELELAILTAFAELKSHYQEEITVAVRSSATAEDLPDASFAGQLETFLNIAGESELLDTCKKCFASLFTDRAISYREAKGFDHEQIALSVGVQKMVRSDLAGSGVMFSIDTETGFKDSVIINAAWGLGEMVVQGAVNPDEYSIFKAKLADCRPIIGKKLGSKEQKMVYASGSSKATITVASEEGEQQSFVLNDDEILTLATWAKAIEDHYGRAMDIEWAKDGLSQELYIVQARPETVESQKSSTKIFQYQILDQAEPILQGLAIGSAITCGKVQLIESASQINEFEAGSILVTKATDPDWVPIMKKANGIITERGGRTSHAAIVSRELGLPVIVGAKDARSLLKDEQEITLSCAEGEQAKVYPGYLNYKEEEIDLSQIPEIDTEIMLNLADPDTAMRWWQLPCDGIGLARMEFIISNIIKVHPMALIDFDKVRDRASRKEIDRLSRHYDCKEDYFVTELARALAKIAASQYPKPTIVRMSDFKSNEYAGLIAGQYFEKEEANPMLGFRGAARYYSDSYKAAFALECKAIKKAREEIGLDNIIIMIPFCRTLEEADKVLELLKANGLERGLGGLQVYVMAEIPSNIILAEEFAERFDGFSIGSNDLTQLTLGISRDSEELLEIFDEDNEAVRISVKELIGKAHAHKTKVGFCGQAPSDKEGYAEFLQEAGIDSISLNPDSVIDVIRRLALSS